MVRFSLGNCGRDITHQDALSTNCGAVQQSTMPTAYSGYKTWYTAVGQWRSHAGAHWGRALATIDAVPHQCRYAYELSALIVSLSIANQALNCLEIERRTVSLHIIHRIASLVRSSHVSLPYK